jgi:PEGA domain/PKD domain
MISIRQLGETAGVLILALALERVALSARNGDPAAGSLLVESEPPGASVFIDGRLSGETPLTVPAIAAGVHRVRVVRLGYLENSRLVTVKAGAQATVRARLTDPAPQAARAAALKIVVLEGEGAINVIQQKTAVAPVVEVRDRNDQPVAGVVVRFAVTKGRAAFNGARALAVTTNSAGRAAVTGFTPTGSGAVQISASAAFQGQTAAVTIAQTNVMTAAQAASAASAAGAGGGGGGGFPTGVVAAAGGAAAGAVVLAKRGLLGGGELRSGCQSMVNGTRGFVDVTAFSFGAECDIEHVPASMSWDFGDGGTATGPSVTHVYTSLGTFRVTAFASNEKGRIGVIDQMVTVTTLTGRWRLANTGSIFDFVQTGSRLTGTYTVPAPGTGTSTFSGTFQHPLPAPQIALTLAGPPSGILNANVLGDDLNSMSVSLSGAGFPFGLTTMTRQ